VEYQYRAARQAATLARRAGSRLQRPRRTVGQVRPSLARPSHDHNHDDALSLNFAPHLAHLRRFRQSYETTTTTAPTKTTTTTTITGFSAALPDEPRVVPPVSPNAVSVRQMWPVAPLLRWLTLCSSWAHIRRLH